MLVCWQYACQTVTGCDISTFSCHEHHAFTNITYLNSLCPIDTPDAKLFDFGIFLGILQFDVPRSTNFLLKLTNCFSWGLRNLSSLGSNLQPSTNIWENLFVAFTSVIGLLLFLYLVGNLQTYMQLETARTESRRHERKMKIKRDRIGQELELWLSKSLVPAKSRDNIKSQILERVQEELDDNRKIDGLHSIFSILPLPLRMDIKDCSVFNRLKKVPVLQDMDEEELKAICEYFKPMRYTNNDTIIEEGNELQLMLIIVDGVVGIEKRDRFSQRVEGELCGEELLSWPILPAFPYEIPSATESARAMGDVEALVLMASDFETVCIRFLRRLKKYHNSETVCIRFQRRLQTEGRLKIHPQYGRIFNEEDLKEATNQYHAGKVLGEGGYSTVYIGILPDHSKVAVKKTKEGRGNSVSVNEVIVLSSINHKNVVRLIGCCFETKTPALVLEFFANGTLYDHIHPPNGRGSPPLPLESRIKVAAEIARALAYLHSAVPPMIIHRDVKSTNILLDENYTAKLIDFEHAILVDGDRDHVDTSVIGTVGYLDPEYYCSRTLTAKADVYSFGVVLMELLTSRKAYATNRPQEERSLDLHFRALVEQGRLDHIFDHDVVSDGNLDTAVRMAGIAERCTRSRVEERPSMEEVATELEVLMGI